MAMMLPNGREMRAGETVYLRCRVLGFDTDYDGVQKAVVALMDADGNYDADEQWFFREKQLAKAAVIQADIERRARELSESRKKETQ